MIQVALSVLALVALVSEPALPTENRVLITGDSPEQVQENAYKKDMSYPVGPLECGQRCRQWWAK